MITIQSTPPDILFAGNPSLYKIFSDNKFVTAGRKCTFLLEVLACDIVDGHTLTIATPEKSFVFTTTVRSPLDESGLDLPCPFSTHDQESWSLDVYNCLKANFHFCSLFNVTREYIAYVWCLRFTAINEGTNYTATVTTTIANLNLTGLLSGIDPVARDNFSILGGIWDKNMNPLFVDAKSLDSSGNVTFNFSEYLCNILDNNLLPKFTFPFDQTVNYKLFSNYILEFYAGFAERYSVNVLKIHFDALRSAVPGGLNRETLVAYNAAGQDFLDGENLRSFLSWAPLVKTTGKTVPEKLFFLVYKGLNAEFFELVVKVWFTDGTCDFVHSGPFAAAENDVIECSVGYKQLKLESLFPTKIVASWDVTLDQYQTGVLGLQRTFILDQQVYEHERIFIFQNSFARAYDVVRFTGKGSINLEYDYAVNNYRILEQDSFYNAPSRKSDTSEVQKMITNSGWISQEMKDYLRDMLLSRQVFEIKDNLLYPIVITNNQVKEYFIDGKYLYSLDLEYDRAYRDFFFQ